MSEESQPIRASLAGVCPLCGVPLDLNSSACRRCGVTPKRVGQCIHCRSTSSVRAEPNLGWVCEVCGGARLVHVAFEQDPAIQEHLAAATRNNRRSVVLRLLSVASGAFGAVLVLLALSIRAAFTPSGSTSAALLLVPALVVLLSFILHFRAKARRKATAAELEQAQARALTNLLADFPNGAVASQLASLLQISHTRAEQLLTRLNVRDDIESMVADDGQLLFRIRGEGPVLAAPSERLRVPTESPEDANALDTEAQIMAQHSQKVRGE